MRTTFTAFFVAVLACLQTSIAQTIPAAPARDATWLITNAWHKAATAQGNAQEAKIAKLQADLAKLQAAVAALGATPAPPATQPTTQPQIEPQPPTLPPQTPSGPIVVQTTVTAITDKLITTPKPVFHVTSTGSWWEGGQGISCDATGVETLAVSNTTIRSFRYGIWAAGAWIILDHVDIDSAPSGDGDGDDYCIRGDPQHLHLTDCTLHNVSKGVCRIYGCTDFQAKRTSFVGGRFMAGGGGGDEWKDIEPYVGTATECRFKCDAIIVYAKSDLTLDRCDLAGTDHVSVDGHLTLTNCTNVPAVMIGAAGTGRVDRTP